MLRLRGFRAVYPSNAAAPWARCEGALAMSELDPSTLGWFNEALGHALRGLDREHVLRPEQTQQLRGLVRSVERYPVGGPIRNEGQGRRLKWIVTGWASEMHVLADTRRQICSFLLPGDVFAVPGSDAQTPCTIVALTRLDCLDVHQLLAPLTDQAPLMDLMERRLADGRDRRYDHMLRLGRLTAPQRLVHLLLELHERLRDVGLADAAHFRLPLTQEHLADALGLSVVHVNRSLRMLRRSRLLEVRFGGVHLLDLEQLAALASRDPQPS